MSRQRLVLLAHRQRLKYQVCHHVINAPWGQTQAMHRQRLVLVLVLHRHTGWCWCCLLHRQRLVLLALVLRHSNMWR